MIYSYLGSKRGLDDTIGFTINYLVNWLGFTPNRHKNGVNNAVINVLSQLKANNYISIDGDYNDNKSFCMASINPSMCDVLDSFALIYFDEFEKIRNFRSITGDKSTVNSSILLLVLAYIRCNMLRRHVPFSGNKSDKPEFCYRMYKDIASDIGISDRYISNSVKLLEQLSIIAAKELSRYKDENDGWHTSVTMFVDQYRRTKNGNKTDPEYNYTDELRWGEIYIKEKKFLNKKFYQDI